MSSRRLDVVSWGVSRVVRMWCVLLEAGIGGRSND